MGSRLGVLVKKKQSCFKHISIPLALP